MTVRGLVSVRFCFDLDAVSGETIVDLIQSHLGFEPVFVRGEDVSKKRTRFKPTVLAKLRPLKTVGMLRLDTDAPSAGLDGPSFSVQSGPSWSSHSLYWEVAADRLPTRDMLDKLTALQGFNAGFAADADDVFWQSMTDISTYDLYKRSHSHLPKIRNATFNEDCIDISKNPGRRDPFLGMSMQVSWRMWFGSGFFNYVPRDRVLAFKGARAIEELPSGAVFVELYEDPFGAEKNRDVQAAFRAWV